MVKVHIGVVRYTLKWILRGYKGLFKTSLLSFGFIIVIEIRNCWTWKCGHRFNSFDTLISVVMYMYVLHGLKNFDILICFKVHVFTP